MTIREKVARALWNEYGKGNPWDWLEPRQKKAWLRSADAALAALPLTVEQLEQIAQGEARLTQAVNVRVTKG